MDSAALRRRGPVIAIILCAIAGAVVFNHIIGLKLVLANAPFWRAPHNDMATMLTGALAVMQAPWTFPLTMSNRIVSPETISVVYTDSIPWLIVTLKALGLGKLLNPLGLYLMISYVMQPAAMAILLRALGVRRLFVLLAGGALAVLYPAFLMRHGHVALTGHWIIMLSLALSVMSARQGLTARRIAGFAALGALSAGVHAYFLPPLGVCFGAALLSELVQKRPHALRQVAVAVLAMGAAVGLAAVALGYGAGQGITGGGAVVGFYSMNILGPFLPQGSAIFGQTWNGGWFSQTLDPNGGQWFEGYNYMGAGVLTAIGAGVLISARHSWIVGDKAVWMKRWAPLALGMIALTAAAIGPIGYLGFHKVFELPKPSGVFEWLSLFRCHGRFFWAVGYLSLALALLQIDRLATLRWAVGILCVAVALQVVDTKQMRHGVMSIFAHPASSYHPASLVDAPQLKNRPWVFSPVFDCAPDALDRMEISQLSLIAVRGGGTSNATATARSRGASCATPQALKVNAAAGDRRITVVLGGKERFTDFAARTDCRRFLRGLICGAGLEGVADLRPVEASELIAGSSSALKRIQFDQGVRVPELIAGWAAPDPHGTWSDGLNAVIEFTPPPNPQNKPLSLELEAMSFAVPPDEEQVVTVAVGGEVLATWHVERANWRPYYVTVPTRLMKAGAPVRLEIAIPGAPPPTPPEKRRIGLGLKQLSMAY